MELDRISFDSRTPVNRLRRKQLWDVAKKLNIAFPKDASGEQMVKLIEASGIDVHSPASGIKWVPIQGSDEYGRPHVEYEPLVERPPPKEIDYASKIEERAARAEAAEKTAADEAAQLRKELEALKKLIVSPGVTVTYEKCAPWMLRQELASRGLEHSREMTKEQMIEKLKAHDANPWSTDGQNTAPGSQ